MADAATVSYLRTERINHVISRHASEHAGRDIKSLIDGPIDMTDMHEATRPHVELFSACHSVAPFAHWEEIEDWVINHISAEAATGMVARESGAAQALAQWVTDDGLGEWSGYDRAPSETFKQAVSSWFHDLIGAPLPD